MNQSLNLLTTLRGFRSVNSVKAASTLPPHSSIIPKDGPTRYDHVEEDDGCDVDDDVGEVVDEERC